MVTFRRLEKLRPFFWDDSWVLVVIGVLACGGIIYDMIPKSRSVDQDVFCVGYQQGWKRGYCGYAEDCEPPTPPSCPNAPLYSREESIQLGFEMGAARGMDDAWISEDRDARDGIGVDYR